MGWDGRGNEGAMRMPRVTQCSGRAIIYDIGTAAREGAREGHGGHDVNINGRGCSGGGGGGGGADKRSEDPQCAQ